ncbi:MAG: response regulator [Calditrichaeota bacterium]|nr:MAG: response regulator [Calditrichota bacterium]
MRILIVDDDLDSIKLISSYLSPLGECDHAANGEEAIELYVQSFEEGQPYDLVCLDIMMPHLDGQAALKMIRGIEAQNGVRLGKGAKIVMTTALSDNRNQLRSFMSLCDAYLVKPFDKETLIDTLRQVELISA